MKERAEQNLPFLTGAFTDETLVYTWKGANGKDDAPEPAIVFRGEVSVAYNPDMTDNEVIDLLVELASRLGTATHQTRVYLTYKERSWIIQAEGKFSPRSEDEQRA
jgi:hypothetical protein